MRREDNRIRTGLSVEHFTPSIFLILIMGCLTMMNYLTDQYNHIIFSKVPTVSTSESGTLYNKNVSILDILYWNALIISALFTLAEEEWSDSRRFTLLRSVSVSANIFFHCYRTHFFSKGHNIAVLVSI